MWHEKNDSSVFVTANRYSYLSKMGADGDAWTLHSPIYVIGKHRTHSELLDALRCFVARHDGLRLRAKCTDGIWQQWIHDGKLDALTYPYSGRFDDHLYVPFVQDRIREVRSFMSLQQRNLVFLISEDQSGDAWHIIAVFHHALFDAASSRIFFREMLAFVTDCGISHLDPQPASYREFCLDYKRRCAAQVDDGANYWRLLPWQHALPTPCDDDKCRGELDHRWTVEHEMLFSRSSFDNATRAIARTGHPSIAAVLLATAARAYGMWTGRSHLFLDLAYHGRPVYYGAADFTDMIGWTSETVPLIIVTDGSTLEIIEAARSQLYQLEAFAPLYGYCRYLCSRKSTRCEFITHPEPDISLNIVMNQSHVERHRAGVMQIPQVPIAGRRVHLISGGAMRTEKYFRISWDYSSKAFLAASVTKFLSLWCRTLIDGFRDLGGGTLDVVEARHMDGI